MKFTLIKEDGVVGIDGLFLPVDMASVASNIRAVQWNGTSGHEELIDSQNVTLTSLSKYQQIVDAWQLANTDRIARQDPYYGMSLAEKDVAILAATKAGIAAQRYEMETGGVAYGGMTILTDRESVQILDSTVEKIRRGLMPAIYWKCPEGYLTLTAANIEEIEIAVLTHVQTAFAWEKAQLEAP